MRKSKILFLAATILIAVGIGSTVYVRLFQSSSEAETLLVGKEKISLPQLFDVLKQKKIKDYQGIVLGNIIEKAGVENPEKHNYTIVAADGYQKTVSWENFKEGILTREKRVVFFDLPRQYWVEDVVKIEEKNE
ncbi:hypothetical protein E3J84_01625 [Candidatus Aerophobetes bacterium]|uniref:Uncharacterized protein n=1 Tax=Aerophobetes bacterium TaxID=2030807 RepID=A0A523S346_UNCAE|nr:MAG: hypothetical protein E3J84_01625 [Candidatus Aerophobetes bacterium]